MSRPALERPAVPAGVVPYFDFARTLAVTVEKARHNIVRLAERPCAVPFATDGNYFTHAEGFVDIGNWTSSFHTGKALLAFEATRGHELLRHVNRLGEVYEAKVTRHRADTMHDLGFLYSLYSVVLYRLTGGLEHRRPRANSARPHASSPS